MGDQVERYARVLFVSGSGRSGTNITKDIFSKHASIATLPFEYRFTIDPRGVVDFYNTYPNGWSPFWPDQKINDFIGFLRALGVQGADKEARVKEALKNDPKGLRSAPPSYPGWDLEQSIPGYLGCVDALEDSLVQFRYGAVWPGTLEGTTNSQMIFAPKRSQTELRPILQTFLEQVTRSILDQQQKEVFLEDNTYSMLFAKELLELYPNSCMLHVVRDPRDVVASVMHQRWTPSELDHVIIWYKEIMKRWEEQERSLDLQRVKTVRFEDLVHNKDEVVRDICAFFKVECEDQMLHTDLTQSHIGRHREELNPDQIELLNRELSHQLKKYHYTS